MKAVAHQYSKGYTKKPQQFRVERWSSQIMPVL